MRKIVREVRRAPVNPVVENIAMRRALEEQRKLQTEILKKRDDAELRYNDYERRFDRRVAAVRVMEAKSILKRVRESAPATATPSAIDDDAAAEFVRAILSGEVAGTEKLSQQERINFAVRRLRAAFANGALPAGGDASHLGGRHHGGPGRGVALPG